MKRTLSKSKLFCCAGLLLTNLLLQSCATPKLQPFPAAQSYQDEASDIAESSRTGKTTLRVMTLNMAHGRGDSLHQLLQGSATTLDNLGTIATLLRNTDPDVVALQEADGPSFWSGNFNHVDYLANQASFSHSIHGTHFDAVGLSYGTALLANLELQNGQAITFDSDLSPLPKGFVLSTIRWPGQPCVHIDLVSVHLDPASKSARGQQIRQLIEALRARKRPAIIMGDLNSEWHPHDSVVRYLSQALSLSAYDPERTDLDTFPTLGERLDWILVSQELAFHSYRVVPDVVSDHRGVIAELALDDAARFDTDSDPCSMDTVSRRSDRPSLALMLRGGMH